MRASTNEPRQSDLDYLAESSTDGLRRKPEDAIRDEVKIDKAYGLAKPVRKVIRAKIYSE